MKIKFILFGFAIISLLSCQQILDDYWERKDEENYVSPFKGTYKGTYSGDEVGTLTIDVAENGYTTVTKTSIYGTEESALSGMVRHDGALQSVVLRSGFTLRGNFITRSGIWNKGDWTGDWTVTEQ